MLQHVNHTPRDDLRCPITRRAYAYHHEQRVNTMKLAEDASRGRRLSGLKMSKSFAACADLAPLPRICEPA